MSLFTVSVPAKAPLSLTSIHELYNKMEGRDKLGKLVQYGARGVAWYQGGQGKDIKATRVFKGTSLQRQTPWGVCSLARSDLPRVYSSVLRRLVRLVVWRGVVQQGQRWRPVCGL